MQADYTHAIILDFEATCDKSERPKPQEIIEFPSVLLPLDTLVPTAEFSSFVRPVHHPRLTSFCTELTAIQQEDVDSAPTFPEVFAAHRAWLEELSLNDTNALIVTCGDWDLRTMFPRQCAACDPPIIDPPAIYTRWLDIKKLYSVVHEQRGAPSMARMLELSGIELIGHHHRGIDDSRNIAKLLVDLLERGGSVQVTGQQEEQD